ncbi:zinc finger domain-containing protein [Streptomyces sp. NPDC001142]
MEPEQIPQLIAEIALADPRVKREDKTERRAQAFMWAGILADVPYDYAVTAAHQHYAKSTWPILPADIATRWAATVRDRMRHDVDPAPPVDPDNEAAYRHALAARRRAVATGQQPPAEHKMLTSGPAAAEVEHRMAELGGYMPPSVREALAQNQPEARRTPYLGLAVPCPHCRAAAGQRCTIPASGRRMPHPHPSRVDAAQGAAA